MSLQTIQNATGRRGGWGNPGEATTASNVGAGAQVFKAKTGYDLAFRSIVAGTGITVTQGTDIITVTNSAPGEANTASNLGAGTGLFASKVGVDLQFKGLAGGTGISLGATADTVTVTNSAPESTSVSNVGTGAGQVYKSMTGTQVNLKTIKAGTNVTVTNNADDITISSTDTGEANTASNLGAGTGLFASKVGVDLQFKGLAGGTGISLGATADTVTVTNSAPESTSVSNVGTGAGLIYRDMTGAQVNLKTIKAGTNVTVTNNADDITIAATGGGPGTGTQYYFPYWATTSTLSSTSPIRISSGNIYVERTDSTLFQVRFVHTTTAKNVSIYIGNSTDGSLSYITAYATAVPSLEINAYNGLLITTSAGDVNITGAAYVQLREDATLNAFRVSSSGFIWQSNAPVQYMKLDFSGNLVIGTGAVLTNSRLTVRGTASESTPSIDIRTGLANSIGKINAHADSDTILGGLWQYGSGASGYPLGSVPSANATVVGGYGGSGLVIKTDNGASSPYLPIEIGQVASSTARQQIYIDASGNIVLNYLFPTHFGDAGISNGTHRLYKSALTGELEIQKKVGGSFVSDVGTYEAIASGTTYNLTSTYALINFGTTDPQITILRPGTYLILVHIGIESLVIISTGGDISLKVRRTNNTAADIAENVWWFDDASYTESDVYGVGIRPIIYTTANSDDILQVWGKFTGVIGSGALEVIACSITAVRLR